MDRNDLEKMLVCPRCKRVLSVKKQIRYCTPCKSVYKKKGGIWSLLHTTNKQTKRSLTQYDALHENKFGGPDDGSYEILASIARGNKSIDIACGTGLIEKLSPQTVGVDFSLSALRQAKRNGAKYLVLADAQSLPFKDNSFDVAISAGSLEHFENPQRAIDEMARVSKIQVMTVHRYPPFPLAPIAYKIATNLLKIVHQPIEKPVSQNVLEKMLKKSNLRIIFKGVWTLPLNYGRAIKLLPEFKTISSCWFVISIKQNSKVKPQSIKLLASLKLCRSGQRKA